MKAMTARDYRANAEKRKAQRPAEVVELKSGSVFELRRPDLQGMVVTGRLPQTLLTEAMAAWKKSGIASPEQIAKQLEEKEVIDSLVFMREVVHESCVNPKFVEFATADDEIGAADMLPEDFTEIFQWAMGYQGVAGLDGLKSFRDGRQGAVAGDSVDSAEQRSESQPVVEPETVVQ